MTMTAVVTHRHVLITIREIFAVVDHFLYIDWLVELVTPDNCIYTLHINIKILEIWLSENISYVNLSRKEDQLWTGSGFLNVEKF